MLDWIELGMDQLIAKRCKFRVAKPFRRRQARLFKLVVAGAAFWRHLVANPAHDLLWLSMRWRVRAAGGGGQNSCGKEEKVWGLLSVPFWVDHFHH